MIGRVLLAVLLAGIAAGLTAGIIQHVRMTPLILQAEIFETVGEADASGHTHEHQSGATEWAPQEGFERTAFTIVTTALAGAGWACMLAGISFLLGLPITRENGVIWGLCGFVAVTLAPSAGLPPELPGMAAAELNARIAWWCLTIACTGFALWLVIIKRDYWAIGAALAIVVVPHVIGAPQPPSHDSHLSAGLVQQFVAGSLATNGLFWGLVGLFLGIAMQHFEKDVST